MFSVYVEGRVACYVVERVRNELVFVIGGWFKEIVFIVGVIEVNYLVV